MRFWWPGSRTPIFLMSLQAGGRGRVRGWDSWDRQAAVGGGAEEWGEEGNLGDLAGQRPDGKNLSPESMLI